MASSLSTRPAARFGASDRRPGDLRRGLGHEAVLAQDRLKSARGSLNVLHGYVEDLQVPLPQRHVSEAATGKDTGRKVLTEEEEWSDLA
jgi:hypothetical protein